MFSSRCRYIGQTFQSGESADGEPQSATEHIKRAMEEATDDAKDFVSSSQGVYRPDDADLYDTTSFGDSLKTASKRRLRNSANSSKQRYLEKMGMEYSLTCPDA